MAGNFRVYYAIQQAGIKPLGSVSSFSALHGLQSVSITTTFNLEQVFELGQLEIYENIEGRPDVEVVVEKVLDGYEPVYVKATQGAAAATLAGRSNQRCHMALSIFRDTQDSATGTPTCEVEMSGLYVSSVSYTANVDGNCTETVNFVGNDKIWHKTPGSFVFNGAFTTNDDSPLALTIANSGGVNRREDVLFVYKNGSVGFDVNGAVSGKGTVLPTEIHGISGSGTNNKSVVAGQGMQHGAHVQSFAVNCDFGRTDIFELGRRNPYFRYAQFPTEVTTEITCLATSGDMIDCVGDAEGNISNQTIRLHLREGLLLDMGKKNKLSSVSYSGGDTGGGNVNVTYSYSNFNSLAVYHPQDTTGALWGPPYRVGSGAKV